MRIVAFYDEIKKANETVEKLKNMKIENAFVDANQHYISNRDVKTNFAGNESASSLSALVLESDGSNVESSKASATATDPMVSGISGFKEIADYGYKVVVETNNNNEQKVIQIIKEMDGKLYNPNIDLYEIPNNVF